MLSCSKTLEGGGGGGGVGGGGGGEDGGVGGGEDGGVGGGEDGGVGGGEDGGVGGGEDGGGGGGVKRYSWASSSDIFCMNISSSISATEAFSCLSSSCLSSSLRNNPSACSKTLSNFQPPPVVLSFIAWREFLAVFLLP